MGLDLLNLGLGLGFGALGFIVQLVVPYPEVSSVLQPRELPIAMPQAQIKTNKLSSRSRVANPMPYTIN